MRAVLARLTGLCAFLAVALVLAAPARAETAVEQVQTSWRLLDYIAVDYREAVAGGRVDRPGAVA